MHFHPFIDNNKSWHFSTFFNFTNFIGDFTPIVTSQFIYEFTT